MALKDTDPNVEYPYFFMVEQSIFQSKIVNVSNTPSYSLSIAWKKYKVLEDGTMVFSLDKAETYYDDDYFITAYTDSVGGNLTHMNTLGAQQLSIKKIIEAETGSTLEVI
jgi:hypothetical protein